MLLLLPVLALLLLLLLLLRLLVATDCVNQLTKNCQMMHPTRKLGC